LKIAFTGKGGVGKTTLASLFIKSLSEDGKEILAVDCDPDSNLALTLGFEDAGGITPIAHMEDMINERMGVDKANRSFYKLNPKIDDIPDAFARTNGNIKLIVMGAVGEGGSGCMCPENTFIKNLLSHLVLRRGEHVVMDMEAGVEHFGRGTAEGCDFIIAVVEPTVNSIDTAKRISGYAREIGIKRIFVVGNKIRNDADRGFIEKELGDIRLLETVGFDAGVLDMGKNRQTGVASMEISGKMERIKKMLQEDDING